MKEIILVFTKSKKSFPIISWLIRLYTRKPYSHVARHKVVLGEHIYYQASEGKVNYENESVFDKKHEVVKAYKLDVPDELERKMARRCLMSAGKKYAFMQNLGIVWVDICKFFGKKVENPWKDGENCPEAMFLSVLKYMYPEECSNYDANSIKPHDLENLLISKGYKPINKYK